MPSNAITYRRIDIGYNSITDISSAHTDALAMVTLVVVATTLTLSVTAYTTLMEPTVRGVFPSTMTSHGDMVPRTMPSLASPVTVTTMPRAVTTMLVWTHSPTAMRWGEEGCVMTARTTRVRN